MNNILKYTGDVGFTLTLCAMVIFGCQCGALRPKADPLTGFHHADEADMDKNKAITDDYRDYIQNLSPKEKEFVGPILYFENETGQHAVQIETDIGGKDCWYHILFYDKENKRTKVIKYFYGRYQS